MWWISMIIPLPRLQDLLIFTEVHNPHLEAVTLYGLAHEISKSNTCLCPDRLRRRILAFVYAVIGWCEATWWWIKWIKVTTDWSQTVVPTILGCQDVGIIREEERCPSGCRHQAPSQTCLKFKKHKNSWAINPNKEQARAARPLQMISQQDRELILFHKKDSELSGSLTCFKGIKVLLSAINTAPQSCYFILLHRFVDKTDEEL